MKNGSAPIPIPPDLLDRLGTPEARIGEADCWLLATVAKAIGCSRSAVANWFREGRIPHAIYKSGRWWIPRDVATLLATKGIPFTGTYRPLSSRGESGRGDFRPKVYRDPRYTS